MERIYSLVIYLLLGCLAFNAQSPCSDFNASSNPAGNWAPSPAPNGNVSVNFGSPNALDGSQHLILGDKSGGSWYQNTTDFRDLGKRFLGQCLYFDFYLKNDSGFGQPYHPFIIISNGVHYATFTANVTVTPGSGWVRIKAPIQFSSGGVLPSNSDGSWALNTSSNPADFDNLMMTSTTLIITPDITTTQQEIVFFDNICVKPCTDCTADFNLDISFNTLNNTANANLTIINPILFSTPGSPGPTYVIDWGDGTSSNFIYPTTPHTYSTAGTYTVCVTENEGKFSKCRRCFTFCYRPSNLPSKEITTTVKAKSSISELEAIAKAERQADKQNDFSIVPNPAKSYIEISTIQDARETVYVRIIDTSGKTVLEKNENLDTGHQSIKINIEKMNQGNYIVELKSNGKISSQKLIISK
ncbi:T9SS type A sorting domain-containing protein [Chryseobacterium sp. L7]|uniref:T9SS type A sorting domain-containing protein n=1 Tax=Chryseobacterium endalhagicum TaxID=2797638 RepID=A0ABS1QDL2_9FLAO|nr:T9SS type A sorting domain-containing protein [Chryseobacterium endalhagicum]MBL1220699.1 T9SS type A sorting domain-containing protein [Chryseobacterium endalhagicum]